MSLTTTINSPDPTNAESDQHDHDDHADDGGAHAGNHCDRQAAKWKLNDLKPFPLQEQFFQGVSEEADLQLAADMQKNGQQVPAEILPDGTIIKGHRRTAAAKHNGCATIDVIVRHDLVGNKEAIEEEFLNDNYLRRHLSPLQQARCAQRLQDLAKGGKLSEYQQAVLTGKTRDKIGRLLGVSGKTVSRWLRILKTPLEVQLAFDAKKLGIEIAQQVEGLCQDNQEEIAAEIKARGIEHATVIVLEYLPKKAETPKGPNKVYMKLRHALREAFQDGLADNVESIGWQLKEDCDLLEKGEQLLEQLRLKIEEIHEDDDEEFAA